MPHGSATYGSIVRTARLGKGMSLADLADATGLSAAFLSRLERGERRELTLSNAIAICDVLDLSLDRVAKAVRRKQQ